MRGILYWIIAFIMAISFLRHRSRFNVKDFAAVTRFEGIDAYYQSLRGPDLGSWPTQLPATKDVCRGILTSNYFAMRREEYVDMEAEEVLAQLRTTNPDVLSSVFRRLENTNDIYEYENAYQVQKVRVEGIELPEYVIICLARDGRSFKEYFVSRQYNVNSVGFASPIYGRFVFWRNAAESDLALLALAEQPATAWRMGQLDKSVEAVYADFISASSHEPSELLYPCLTGPKYISIGHYERHFTCAVTIPTLDPVCKLSDAHKLRLCASVFGSTIAREDGLKFVPTMNNVQLDCTRKRITFTTLESRTPVGWLTSRFLRDNRNRTFEEWVIGCVGSTRTGDPLVYYVSRAAFVNAVHVFTETGNDGRISPFNWYSNVSVVDKARLR